MQDCKKSDLPPKVPDYCFTMQGASEPSLIARGCAGIEQSEWHVPEPPLGGAVCVDVDIDDQPPQKVFNE